MAIENTPGNTSSEVAAIQCPLCGETLDTDPRRTCWSCHTSDRNRSVYQLYEALRPLLKSLHGLNLTIDQVVAGRNYFAEETRSVYLGENSIDVQSIGRPDDFFDFAVCNHVLEHVPDDKASIKELVRVCKKAVQITVPVTSKVFKGEEYGAADPDRLGHFRHYGADYPSRVHEIVPQTTVITVILRDAITDNFDVSYLIIKDKDWAQLAFTTLLQANLPCVIHS